MKGSSKGFEGIIVFRNTAVRY